MPASDKDAEIINFGRAHPKNSFKIARKQRNKILAQRSMGCLGQVTKVFGHFFYVLTNRFLISWL